MKKEIRSVGGLELRAESGMKIAGIAAATGTVAHIGNFDETIAKGAFTRALKERQNVFCLKEHNPNFVLGATKSGTLSLSEADNGSLLFMCQLDSRQSSHVDLWNAVQRKDLDSMSFGFAVHGDGEEWRSTGKTPLRVLKDLDVFDVSVVCRPAYSEGTSVAARSYDYNPVPQTVAVPTLAFLKEKMLQQRCEIFRDWHAIGGAFIFREATQTFEMATDAEVDLRNRARVRILGEQLKAEARAEELCACRCDECRDENCPDCEMGEDCEDPNCDHEKDQ